MENYAVYSMMQPNGQLKIKAIIQPLRVPPEDYFIPGSKDLKNIGTLEIDGTATHYLNESFEI